MISAPKREILVVEDFDDTRDTVAEYLDHQGYSAVTARNGVEALMRLAELLPDVIVSDLDMPKMGGAELVRRLEADPLTKSIPVILLTGSGIPQVSEQLGEYARHVKSILVKPVKLSDLWHAIKCALEDGDPK